MKNLTLFILIYICSALSLSAQIDPVSNELRNRVPELPVDNPIILQPPIHIVETPPAPPPTTTPPAPPPPIHHDSLRNVYWLHGFGGNRDRWSDARDASQNKSHNTQGFMARKLNGHAPEYVENGSLDLAAQEVATDIINHSQHQSDTTSAYNFIIGHSQGGIVGRYLVSKDHCSDDPTLAKDFYGGLVTFSSSLNGAHILNKRDNGDIDYFTEYVCDRVLDLTTSGFSGEIAQFVIKDAEGVTGASYEICQAFKDQIVPILFKGLQQPISNDYVVGSPILDEMNACEAPEIAKVAFYGVEPHTMVDGSMFYNPIFYRTVQHFFTDVNSKEVWSANNDSEMAIEQSAKAEERLSDYHKYKTRSQIFKFMGGFLTLWLGSEAKEKSQAHLELYYLYHDMGTFWLNLIGANVWISYTHNSDPDDGYCECDYDQHDQNLAQIVANANNNGDCLSLVDDPDLYPAFSNCHWTEELDFVTTFINKPSDGVVLQESAEYMTGATWPSQLLRVRYGDTGIPNEQNNGSSHMQARNDRNTRDALRALYDGELDPFFWTAIKQ